MEGQTKFLLENVYCSYNGEPALYNINLKIPSNAITVVFGPSGSGKTTLLRILNRLNDLVDNFYIRGQILLDGQDIYAPKIDVRTLRRRVGMVFALPLPLPGSIRGNIEYGPKLIGIRNHNELDEIVERCLIQAALWTEVKDRLTEPASALSGGQQQRLCIARSLALEPEVILLDEPTSGLDPLSTGKVEETLFELKQNFTIVIIPHSVQQAARIADLAAFFLLGELIETKLGRDIFTHPDDKRTEDYVTGRFG